MSISHAELSYLFDFLYKRSAIVLTADKEYLVEARLGPLARDEGLGSIEELIFNLRSKPSSGLQVKVVEAMTTHETSFFRDEHPFEAMRGEILPALRAARGKRPLQIVSAACSTGQEPYSLAILVRESFPDLAGSVRILATDLSQSILTRAKEGLFQQIEINRGLPASLLHKYFQREGTRWRAGSVLRDMIEFRQMNLIEPWPTLPTIDVLFLRNVLIYFDQATKRAILARARHVLAPDGYLFLGGGETTFAVDESYERVQIGRSVFYRPSSVIRMAPPPR